ncbi:hypothetical protein ANO11243_054620 [Dothideomycetidae sp. 11243]|nr:hypothetical protein ANO11243_054620 [fungal sp. No.11243]
MLSFIFGALNRLLPFATPGTPLIQDLVHLGVVCTLLYFAPQIQSLVQDWTRSQEAGPSREERTEAPPVVTDGVAPEVDADTRQADLQEGTGTDRVEEVNIPPTHHEPPPPAPGAEGPAFEAPEPLADHAFHGVEAGPSTGRARAVGAKKAKSLARRDQRRAYNEFVRSQSEAQRARDNEGRAEREAELAAEQARRKAVEDELRERERAEREERRVEEERQRELERRRREGAVGLVREGLNLRGWVELEGVASSMGKSVEWMEGLVRASGLLREKKGEEVVFITEGKVAVRVTSKDMDECWKIVGARVNVAQGGGRVRYEEVGKVLESVVKSRAGVHS